MQSGELGSQIAIPLIIMCGVQLSEKIELRATLNTNLRARKARITTFTLVAPAFVAWHRALLPNVGSSSSHPLNPE